MESIDINSNLESFTLVGDILSLSSKEISSVNFFNSHEEYILIEMTAQLSALHTRWLVDFNRHAFLLKIKSFEIYFSGDYIGNLFIDAALISSSESSFNYHVSIRDNIDRKNVLCNGDLIISTLEYNEDFSENKIKDVYREIFRCHTKNLKIN